MDEMRELWPGGPLYAGEAVNIDALALADFAAGVRARRGCDLCCGDGIVLLLLALADPGLSVTGVERRADAAARCRANIAANALSPRCRVWEGDLRDAALPAGEWDLVTANPPFFPRESGAVSPTGARAAIRTESASLPELCARAARLLRPGGSFCLIYPTERLAQVLSALEGAGLESKRLRFFTPRWDAAPTRFLCQARRGAAPGLAVEPALVQFGPDGRETAAYRAITHWEA